jgi:amino acid adenylation domain-containing protein
VLLAAFNVLLGRLAGQADLVVGLPVAGQSAAGVIDLVGHCVNLLPVRSIVDGKAAFIGYLDGLRKLVLDAFDHQEVTYGSLLEKVRLPRDRSRLPLVSVTFNLDRPSEAPSFVGLEVEVASQPKRAVNFDLMVNVAQRDDELVVDWRYNTDLFDASTIRRWLGHYRVLLEEIVADPQRRVEELPLLTEAERRQILEEWNDTGVDYRGDSLLHRLVEAQVERTPDAVAVAFEREGLTYRELNRRANQLANHLVKLGVGPEVLVGICMERSLEMVVGLLGILKAGGAYVPLDPAYPRERLAFMLEDAEVGVLVTQERLLGELPVHGAPVVCLDRDRSVIDRESDRPPSVDVGPDNLAYVIFTSGSTGRPKGAMNTHRGITNRLVWMQDRYRLGSEDRVLQKTPISFDVSLGELFPPLLAGARLVVARPEGHQDPKYLVRVITDQAITVAHFVPSMLQVFLEEPDVERCEALRQVVCSGEALPLELQQRFFARLGARLDNLYGPTEAAVEVTCWGCERDGQRGVVPIGRPVANTRIYILDSTLQPVPVGVAGELHIGGVQVGRGYLNRPELTEEKFIPDPFSSEPGARLYRSGDLARFLPDGNVEFLGRLDDQVKVRGYRIELGEIEAAISRHDRVRQAVVLAREDQPGDKRLVAYVVVDGEPRSIIAEVRSRLRESLPRYMVPAAFVPLEAIPLTPSGKIDRRALPSPDGSRPFPDQGFVAPRTPTESTVAEIWRDVLRMKEIGIHENFFDLGGHSFLAVRIVERLWTALGVELPLRSVFDTPTVAALAEAIEARLFSAEQEPPRTLVLEREEIEL